MFNLLRRLILYHLLNFEQVWKNLLKLAESGDIHVRDRAEDIMVRIFQPAPGRKKP